MDEQKLADLFRDAAHDAPPASFDASDVRTASRRATVRRRNSIAAGTTLVVVLGFGGVVAGTNWITQEKNSSTVAGSGQQQDNAAQSPMTALEQGQPTQKDSPYGESSTQGDGTPSGSVDPTVSARAVQGCAGVDRELAVALAGELSVSPEFAIPPTVTCSPDSRSAAFKIDGLTVTAIVTPGQFDAPADARTEKVKTAKGQDLYVLTQGDGEAKGKARQFADALAPRF
ncbi:hypothetical protein [Lentzea kentuckyensis]|uniref:hypothetical protein n=1 Tax=Lentzea kentuckyensis TaxID=360086 RepID=UPI000A3C9086|nr:hypothetical protein [Lentzea kentuckyensis]